MKKWLLTIYFLSLIGSNAWTQGLPLVHYLAESGRVRLPSAHVVKTFQDSRGYLWMLTFSSGMVRYDGVGFDQFTTADGLPDLYVYTIEEDRQGYLWIGCADGLAVSDKPIHRYGPAERIRFTEKVGHIPLDQVAVKARCLVADVREGVWVGNPDEGIIRYRILAGELEKTLVKLPENEEAGGNDIFCLAARRDGAVWAGVTGGLVRIHPDDPNLTFMTIQSGGEEIHALFEDSKGRLWAGGNRGTVWKVNENNQSELLVPAGLQIGGSVSCFLERKDGVMWISGYGGGLTRLDPENPESARTYGRDNGLLSEEVDHLMQDHEENLWISQTLGLSKLRANHEAHVHLNGVPGSGRIMVPASGVQGVVPFDPDSPIPYLVTASEGDGLTIIDKAMNKLDLTTADGLQNDVVNGVARDSKGRIWVGGDLGIDCLSKTPLQNVIPHSEHRVTRVFGEDIHMAGFKTPEINRVRAFVLDDHGRSVDVICFVGKGGIFLFMDDRGLFMGEEAGLPEGDLFAVEISPDGRLWVGSQDHGLFRGSNRLCLETLKGNDVKSEVFPDFINTVQVPSFHVAWSKDQGAPTNHIRSLYYHKDVMWTGTSGGLFVLDPKTMTPLGHLTTASGLGADNITSMAVSPVDESVWVGTNGGISKIDPISYEVVRTVDRREGLVDNEVWYLSSLVVDKEGLIYFGTHKGLSLYDPAKDFERSIQPRLQFHQISWRQNLTGKNQLSLAFRGLSYFDEESVRYKTRLRGYETSWSEPNTQTEFRYTNLAAFFVPKRHYFEVMATTDGETWSKPLVYSFLVNPPFWVRWWALAGLLLVFLGMGYSYSKWRVRYLKARATALERTITQRTGELVEKNATLARTLEELREKNDDILRQQEQLVLTEKMASLGTLTKGIAHELRNPMNFINNLSQVNLELANELKDGLMRSRNLTDGEKTFFKELLEAIEKNAVVVSRHGGLAEHIVSRMLELSTTGPETRIKTGINLLVSEYADMAFRAFQEKQKMFNVALEKDFDPEVGTLRVSPRNLGRAVIGLVKNGLESVANRYRLEPEAYKPVLRVETSKQDDCVCIRVCDNGLGVDKEMQDHLFTPFFTTHPAGSGNVGLGLTVCYEIVVEEHGGELRLLDGMDGAVFEITLPVCADGE
ncbi:MAG: two-component regulator propeller domain-containing protein [Acidobacteriota bacterium]|nr:two-component regulator propeller domain-containing protein [Acidobacteriota bacterium]